MDNTNVANFEEYARLCGEICAQRQEIDSLSKQVDELSDMLDGSKAEALSRAVSCLDKIRIRLCNLADGTSIVSAVTKSNSCYTTRLSRQQPYDRETVKNILLSILFSEAFGNADYTKELIEKVENISIKITEQW